jgi:HK97 family phage portal protein
MAVTFRERLQHGWNAFMNKDPTVREDWDKGASYTRRPDIIPFSRKVEQTIVNGVYTKIAIDVSQLTFLHVRTNDDGKYEETIDSDLNYALNVEANIDQTSRAFIQDVVNNMFDDGCVAIVPIDTTYKPASYTDPTKIGTFDIQTMRVGRIVNWYPQYVKVDVYNDITGKREQIIVPKKTTAIIQNPFYSVMNEPNSILKRLITKLSMLDMVDKQSASGKLDLLIQLPYVLKSQARKDYAEERRRDIEEQLTNTRYGIAYTDGTEHITQLNRPVENNLLNQIQYLTEMFYGQFGLTEAVFNGTANEQEILNYYSRTIEPIASAILDEMKRKFLTKTARSQHQDLMMFRDVFKLTPPEKLADIADKFTRNEIMTSNEFRAVIGYKPSKDPDADELRNKNLNKSKEEIQNESDMAVDEIPPDESVNNM